MKKALTRPEYETLLLSEDFELQMVRAHKEGTLLFPLNEELVRKNLKEAVFECHTGECLGEGWHGGMTSKEWKARGEYFDLCLKELNT